MCIDVQLKKDIIIYIFKHSPLLIEGKRKGVFNDQEKIILHTIILTEKKSELSVEKMKINFFSIQFMSCLHSRPDTFLKLLFILHL